MKIPDLTKEQIEWAKEQDRKEKERDSVMQILGFIAFAILIYLWFKALPGGFGWLY